MNSNSSSSKRVSFHEESNSIHEVPLWITAAEQIQEESQEDSNSSHSQENSDNVK